MSKELVDIINGWITKDKDMKKSTSEVINEYLTTGKITDESLEQEGYGLDSEYIDKNLTYTNDYQFSFTDFNDREVIHNIKMNDDVTYHKVVQHFADFLSSVYGYRINLKAGV